jgi:integrase
MAAEPPTMDVLVEEFFAQYDAEPNTVATNVSCAKHITRAFGDVRVDRLHVPAIAAWRKRLPIGSSYGIHKVLKQVLNYAVASGYIAKNPAAEIPNKVPNRKTKLPFNNWQEVEAVAEAMGSELPIIVAGTGLRSEEWLALEWRDIDWVNGLLYVRRVYVNSRVKEYGKTEGSIRAVPLSARVIAALKRMPRGIGGGLVFPGSRGKHMSLSHWRRNVWYPSLEKAELEKRVPYAMRDTFASLALQAGVPTLHLARIMGTSLEMIDRTYGHMLKDSADWVRGLLDAHDVPVADNGQGLDTGR